MGPDIVSLVKCVLVVTEPRISGEKETDDVIGMAVKGGIQTGVRSIATSDAVPYDAGKDSVIAG